MKMKIDKGDFKDSATKSLTSMTDLEEKSEYQKENVSSESREAIYRKQTEEILVNIGQYPFDLFKVTISKKLV